MFPISNAPVRAVLGAVLAAFALAGCTLAHREFVPQPASSNQAPTFTVGNNVPSSPTGKVDVGISTASGPVNGTAGTELFLTVTASNPVSGVKNLHVEITNPRATLYTVDMTGAKNTSGEVPVYLRAVGTDYAGGNGNNPLRVQMVGPNTLRATATSFDGASSSIEVNYVPWGKPTAEISVSPPVMNLGESPFLVWHTSNALTAEVTHGAFPPTELSGSKPVSPTETTTYKLVAKNPVEWSTPSETTLTVKNEHGLIVTYEGPAESTAIGGTMVSPEFIFTGHCTGPAGRPGALDFSKPVTLPRPFRSNEPWRVSELFDNLQFGSWTVTVVAPGQGTPSCFNVTVPGAVTLSTRPGSPPCHQR